MGCLPVVKTIYSNNPILNCNCIKSFCIARDYNHNLQNKLKALQLQLQGSGSRIAYLNPCGLLQDMISGGKYGWAACLKHRSCAIPICMSVQTRRSTCSGIRFTLLKR